jgi:hypothetical protein
MDIRLSSVEALTGPNEVGRMGGFHIKKAPRMVKYSAYLLKLFPFALPIFVESARSQF